MRRNVPALSAVHFTDRLQVTLSYLLRPRQLNGLSILLALNQLTTGTGLEKTWFQMSCQFMTDRLLVASYHHFPSRCLPFPSLWRIRYLFPRWKDCELTELGATDTESNKWYSKEGREKETGTMIEWAFQSPYHYSLSTQFHDLYFWLLFKRGKFKLDSGLLLNIQSRTSYLSPSRTWLLLTTCALTVRGIS